MFYSLRHAGKVFALVACIFFLAGASGAAPLPMTVKEEIDSFFVKIKRDFDKIPTSPVLKTKRTSVDRLFLHELKSHQPYLSLIRADSKGLVINNVVRLEETKPAKNKESVADQPWFKYVNTKHEAYTGHIKDEERGRYYLVWVAPVLSKGPAGKDLFVGAVELKIDIWDCFHQFAKNTDTPFLVRMEQKGLYSNKWKDDVAYSEEPIEVPGIEKITVRYPRPAAAAAPVDTQIASTAAIDSAKIKATQDSITAARAAKQKATLDKIVIAVAVIALLVLIILLVRLFLALRQRMIMRKIDKEGRL
jgi:hypothetical protein